MTGNKEMYSTEKRTAIFETMPYRKAVCKQIIPAIASQMIALVYNLADTYFVGMLGDPNQTAAVTVAAPSFVMLTAISNLFGIGGASVIASSLGRRDTEKARRTSAVSFWAGLCSAFVFSLLFLMLASPILYLSGATDKTYGITYEYAKWVVIFGGAASISSTLLANLVRAEGRAAAASIGLSMGGLINIVLDIFLVLPHFAGMGAVGAGIATSASNFIAAVYFMIYIFIKRKSTVISLDPRLLKYAHIHIKEILKIGFPSAVQYALTVVAVAAQSKFVSKYATEAVAGLGIVKKLDQLPLYFSIGVSNGLLPLLAYNNAAGNHERRKNAFRFGCVVSFGFALLCLIAYEIFAEPLAGIFIDDALTTEYAAGFLRIMVTAMPLMAVCYPMIVQFQAIGRVKESLICSVVRKGVLDIPLLFILDRWWPLYGCMMVQPVVDAVSLIIAVCLYRKSKTVKPD